MFFDASLDYIVLGREMQIDVTKQALGSIINQLVDLEKKDCKRNRAVPYVFNAYGAALCF
ncbi:hypothetical protein EVA_13620 [gut metagenome]|uniref:Uncharacterized protein n=1 Tax=gut metagenome TaxID=749906 RepID=J9GG07_9ZZZZ